MYNDTPYRGNYGVNYEYYYFTMGLGQMTVTLEYLLNPTHVGHETGNTTTSREQTLQTNGKAKIWWDGKGR